MNREIAAFPPHQAPIAVSPGRSFNVLSLLSERKLYGGKIRNKRKVQHLELASSCAWSPRRMQNMILAVGSETPAGRAVRNPLISSSTSSEDGDDDSSQDSIDNSEKTNGDHEESPIDEDVEILQPARSGRKRYSSSSSIEASEQSTSLNHQTREQGISMDDEESSISSLPERQFSCASMRHSGCINTAGWLDGSWRLSKAQTDDNSSINHFISSSSFSSNSCDRIEGLNVVPSKEYSSQIMTSGDDRVVKFWDVSNSMSRTSPEGEFSTMNPYSSTDPCEMNGPVKTNWKRKKYAKRRNLSGAITHLTTLNTGHRSNVFHATTVPNTPGKIATCAADGCLHLCDIEMQSTNSSASNSASIIIRPDEVQPHWGLVSDMCFSHHFINSNIGLLCCQKGLRPFDLRLPPQAQPSENLLKGLSKGCKSCAIFSGNESTLGDTSIDSAYVFAGGSGGDVGLYDLRFSSSNSSSVVQTYRPSCIDKHSHVSVSGIDISKDKRELLVSYENDQVYTFPILPFVSVSGPSIEDISAYTSMKESNLQRELAGYGAHLNRHTFLKNAKYAGPQDEYICTGSDSGNAWIYEKATGAVVSLLKADRSTCNGIFPHPQLPFFVSYGIEATAKLWRATLPVSDEIDDSNLGRWKYNKKRKYEMSSLVQDWNRCNSKLEYVSTLEFDDNSGGDGEITFTPSEIVLKDLVSDDDSFELLFNQESGDHTSPSSSRIRNNLQSLPTILLENYIVTALATSCSDTPPVECGLKELKRRTNLIRLHHQSNQLGLSFNPALTWQDQQKSLLNQAKMHCKDEDQMMTCVAEAALVPECPSDWLSFNSQLVTEVLPHGMAFNVKDYEDFFLENYSTRLKNSGLDALDYCDEQKDSSEQKTICDNIDEKDKVKPIKTDPNDSSCNMIEEMDNKQLDTEKAWDYLETTILTLKNGGNTALQSGLTNLAARFYDKAIQYCALAFTDFPTGNATFIKNKQMEIRRKWSPLLKTFVSIRLNLSMVMLKSEINHTAGACEQAKLALKDLRPFTHTKGKIVHGSKLKSSCVDEPSETFSSAKELEAKAYFRLGSAKSALGLFVTAVQCFEKSIKCTKESSPNAVIEKVVIRRLAEAKHAKERHKKHQRKKFKGMFSK